MTTSDSGANAHHILIVDDNEDAALSLAIALRRGGYEVEVTATGEEALASVARRTPRVVLLDIGLPGMDGFEVARQMREQPALQEVQIVAITAYSGERERRRGQAAGFDHHLVKPIDFDHLRKLLASSAR